MGIIFFGTTIFKIEFSGVSSPKIKFNHDKTTKKKSMYTKRLSALDREK